MLDISLKIIQMIQDTPTHAIKPQQNRKQHSGIDFISFKLFYNVAYKNFFCWDSIKFVPIIAAPV